MVPSNSFLPTSKCLLGEQNSLQQPVLPVGSDWCALLGLENWMVFIIKAHKAFLVFCCMAQEGMNDAFGTMEIVQWHHDFLRPQGPPGGKWDIVLQ